MVDVSEKNPSVDTPEIILNYNHIVKEKDISEKKVLWDYLHSTIKNWDGDVIIMGDVNEVRNEDECFGSNFNSDGAANFNAFISMSGLVEVPMGGSSFIWVHSCLNISALTLDRYPNNLAIRGILVDGVSINSPSMVRNVFMSLFENRFNHPFSARLSLDMIFPKQLSLDTKDDLEKNVTKDELKRAVWDYGLNKSPGPDGFTFGFYQRYWSFLENHVMEDVSHFFLYGKFPRGGNSSFIALIPKSQNANMVKYYCPISLIRSLYKIMAKILANRLVVVLGDIVSDVKLAFIAGRQILDGHFILNDFIQWFKAKKKQTMIFKVDFEKAFDSVRWDYLDDVLKSFGFGNGWCGCIQTYLRSSRGSILVNGSPTKEFHFHKGLKQGDPLSLFLFILIMECLHPSFQNIVNVDDVVFMGQCKLMGIAADDDTVIQAARSIGCLQLKPPFSNLGSKIGGLMSRINSCDEIVNKLLARLSKWKMKTLSIGSRLTLLK
ncbi:RNA-directed DNA polymerase, eukaryota [Tanacetum coccineum]